MKMVATNSIHNNISMPFIILNLKKERNTKKLFSINFFNIKPFSLYIHLCFLSNRYGNGFGIIGSILGGDESIFNQPNGINGIVFYILLILLGKYVRNIINLFLVVLIVMLCANNDVTTFYLVVCEKPHQL